MLHMWKNEICSFIIMLRVMGKFRFVAGDRSHPFEAFPTNEAIQATEIYEYAQKLSNPEQVNYI